jgi:hypothetical protein
MAGGVSHSTAAESFYDAESFYGINTGIDSRVFLIKNGPVPELNWLRDLCHFQIDKISLEFFLPYLIFGGPFLLEGIALFTST